MLMPGYMAAKNALATKVSSVYAENTEFPTHIAHILLFNAENGVLLAVSKSQCHAV